MEETTNLLDTQRKDFTMPGKDAPTSAIFVIHIVQHLDQAETELFRSPLYVTFLLLFKVTHKKIVGIYVLFQDIMNTSSSWAFDAHLVYLFIKLASEDCR